jgi:hypothetical protein
VLLAVSTTTDCTHLPYMFLNLTRNRQQVFQVGHHPRPGEQRQVLHQLEHQVRPRLAGVGRVVGEELVADFVEDFLGGQVFSRFSSR